MLHLFTMKPQKSQGGRGATIAWSSLGLLVRAIIVFGLGQLLALNLQLIHQLSSNPTKFYDDNRPFYKYTSTRRHLDLQKRAEPVETTSKTRLTTRTQEDVQKYRKFYDQWTELHSTRDTASMPWNPALQEGDRLPPRLIKLKEKRKKDASDWYSLMAKQWGKDESLPEWVPIDENRPLQLHGTNTNTSGYTGRDNPIVQKLLEKHPTMRFNPLRYKQWGRFRNTTCNTVGSPPIEDWQARVPFAIIIGAQKAGSSSLAHFIHSHPNVVRTLKELHFFSSSHQFVHPEEKGTIGSGIPQKAVRESYWQHIDDRLFYRLSSVQKDDSLHVLDATPMYIVQAYIVAKRILCICPWVKIIATLRNPVDRIFSQYNMEATHDKRRNGTLFRNGFDEWVRQDVDLLTELGILNNGHEDNPEALLAFLQSDAVVHEAWMNYTALGTSMGVGRGLYAAQLVQWQLAYKETSHDGTSRNLDWIILESTEMRSDPQGAYEQVLDFLNFPRVMPDAFTEQHTLKYKVPPMRDETRAYLEALYAPYNNLLASILGPKWEGIWAGHA